MGVAQGSRPYCKDAESWWLIVLSTAVATVFHICTVPLFSLMSQNWGFIKLIPQGMIDANCFDIGKQNVIDDRDDRHFVAARRRASCSSDCNVPVALWLKSARGWAYPWPEADEAFEGVQQPLRVRQAHRRVPRAHTLLERLQLHQPVSHCTTLRTYTAMLKL